MIPSYLIPLRTQAEKGDIEALEDIDELLSTEDIQNMTMEEVNRISKLLPDVKLTNFFEVNDLVGAGYVSEHQASEMRFESMFSEVL
jgi:hypothetical protein